MTKPLTVEFDLAAADVLEFQEYHVRHHHMRWQIRFTYVLALASGLGLGRLLTGPRVRPIHVFIWVAYGLAFVGLWAFHIFVLAPIISRRWSDPRKLGAGVVGRHTISLSADGLREATSVNESFHAWRGVATVEADTERIYVYVNTQGGGGAYVIPRSAFQDLRASEEFFSAAKTWYNAAHNTTSRG